MAITVTEPIQIKLYVPSPPQDSPYPVGEWVGTRQITGDLTAGEISVYFAPLSANEAKKWLWSVEQMDARTASVLTSAYHMLAITAEPHTDGGGAINNRTFARGGALYTSGALFTQQSSSPFEAINTPTKYIHQPDGGLTNSYGIIFAPNSNGIVIIFNAWGYLWHPQARRLASGPRRP